MRYKAIKIRNDLGADPAHSSNAASKFVGNSMLERYLKSLGYQVSTTELNQCYNDLKLMEEFNRTHFTSSGFFYADYICCQFSIKSVTHIEPTKPVKKGLVRRFISWLTCK